MSMRLGFELLFDRNDIVDWSVGISESFEFFFILFTTNNDLKIAII